MPRQMPRYGISSSRATRQARILPSQPREPNPPGHEHAVDVRELGARPRRASSSSASTQRTCTRHAVAMPACFSASCTERYASWSFTYLPTSAISTVSSRSSIRSVRSSHSPRSAAGASMPELAADELVEALLLQRERDEVDVRHVGVRDHRVEVDVGEERDLLADLALQRLGERQTSTSGWIPIRRSSFTECCVGFVFSSPAVSMNGTSVTWRYDDVLGPDLAAELADRLEEGQRLDVADRAADLGDHDVACRSPRRPSGCAP